MRKLVSIMLTLCLMVIPAISFATAEDPTAVTNYSWSSDRQFDMYDLSMSIVMPEGWTSVDQTALDEMNGVAAPDATDTSAPEATASTTALNPLAIAMMSNADATVNMMISFEELEDETAIPDADKYIELFANDIVASSTAEGVTYTYDVNTITDATLGVQAFREMAISGSDGSIIDLLVCHSGMGPYYSIAIIGTTESITSFATEFVGSIAVIEAAG